MTRLTLNDIDPQYREQLGLRKASVRRKVVPEYTPMAPLTEEQAKMQSIRHSLSRIAARLTGKPERVVECLGALRAVVEALEGLVKGDEHGMD